MIEATYVSAATFTVDGEHVNDYPTGLPIKAILDTTEPEALVNTAIYQALEDTTLVSVDAEILDETLTEVQLSPVYEDTEGQSSNLPYLNRAFELWDDTAVVAALKIIAEIATLTGILNMSAGTYTTLIGTAKQILRRNEANEGFEFVELVLDLLNNVQIASLTDGQALIYNAETQKWKNTTLPAVSIAACSDVDLTGITNGQVLKWDSDLEKFYPADDEVGEGGPPS